MGDQTSVPSLVGTGQSEGEGGAQVHGATARVPTGRVTKTGPCSGQRD